MGRLIAIGLVAGVFSALFGVGGGIVIVPLLILAAGFDVHRATATSIGAILLTAMAGVALYAVRGELDPPTPSSSGFPRSPACWSEHGFSDRSPDGRSRWPSPPCSRRSAGGDPG